MAITTNGELKTAIANWLHDDELTSRIPEFIALAEDRIAQRLRIRVMETSATLTTVASTRTVALPTRFKQARRLYRSADPVVFLEYLSPQNYWETHASDSTGLPVAYTIEGENFVFGPVPDGVYSILCLYYQRLADFSADADTNSLLTDARGLYLYGALVEAAPFLGDDPRIKTWASLYEGLEADVIKSDKRDRHSGSALRMHSGVNAEGLR